MEVDGRAFAIWRGYVSGVSIALTTVLFLTQRDDPCLNHGLKLVYKSLRTLLCFFKLYISGALLNSSYKFWHLSGRNFSHAPLIGKNITISCEVPSGQPSAWSKFIGWWQSTVENQSFCGDYLINLFVCLFIFVNTSTKSGFCNNLHCLDYYETWQT